MHVHVSYFWQLLAIHGVPCFTSCLPVMAVYVFTLGSCHTQLTSENRSHITHGFTHLHYELTLTSVLITARKITDKVTVLFGFLLL